VRIILNLSGRLSGGGLQVSMSFLTECKKFDSIIFFVFVNDNIYNDIVDQYFPDNFFFIRIKKHHLIFRNYILTQHERKIVPDVVFTPFGPVYWKPRAPHLVGFAIAHYLYPNSLFWDSISFSERLSWWIKKQIHLFYFKRDSKYVVCETFEVKNILSKILNKHKIFVVSNTYSSHFKKQIFSNVLINRANFTLLYLSSYYKHKNIEIIPLVIDKLVSKGFNNFTFCLTIDKERFDIIFKNNYNKYVTNFGPVSNIDAPNLYANCSAVFMPSLLECFSANYPEAKIMKKPILASDLGFARDICKDAAIYFDPFDPNDIADKIIYLFKNIEVQRKLLYSAELLIKNFPSAEDRALMYLNLCHEIKN
jgi:glycosyltransferase involved in cell wall biosynthesis